MVVSGSGSGKCYVGGLGNAGFSEGSGAGRVFGEAQDVACRMALLLCLNYYGSLTIISDW